MLLNFRKKASAPNEAPKVKLQREHIAGCKIILDRAELLKSMPSGGVVAELGVDKGDFSQSILENCKPSELNLIDTWGSARYGEDKAAAVAARFSGDRRVKITRAMSIEAAAKFPDNYFDWIYVDTDHSYRTTIQELRAWSPKIKNGGYILGHDYVMGNFARNYRYGVIEAVAEFCVEKDWKLAFVTADHTENNSFGITRIGK